MKNLTYLLALLLLTSSTSLMAQRELVPPGTVKIVDNFYVDQTEVTNLSWREFQHWLQQAYGSDSEPFNLSKPDTSLLVEIYPGLASTYFEHPAFDEYPIVGISHDQAVEYCRWRTNRVLEMWAANYKPPQWSHLSHLEYRLPTITEWQLIARLNRDRVLRPEWKEKHPGKFFFNLKQAHPARTLAVDHTGSRDPQSIFTTAVKAYLPGELDIYNLFGNVAEMVETPGVAMGGSWQHTEREVFNMQSFSYAQPENWVGFRCVCSAKGDTK